MICNLGQIDRFEGGKPSAVVTFNAASNVVGFLKCS